MKKGCILTRSGMKCDFYKSTKNVIIFLMAHFNIIHADALWNVCKKNK